MPQSSMRDWFSGLGARLKETFDPGDDEADVPTTPDGEAVVPTNPRPAITTGLVIIAVTFGGFGTWAATAPLNSAVISSGTVKVFSSRQKVQHLEGGIVREILVSNGDRVEAGQTLVRLDQTRALADYARVQGQYDQARTTVARLMAERDDLEDIVIPEDLTERAGLENVDELIEGQRTMFIARRQSRDGQLSMVNERINQLSEEINGLEAQAAAKSEQIRLIGDELEGLRELHEKGFAPKTRILALERGAAELRGELGDHKARMAQAKVQISEAELEKLQVLKSYKEQVVSELRERQTEMYDLAETLDKARFTLEETDIKAATAGVVVNKQVSAIGQVIRPGELVLEIVPQDDTLIIEAQVRIVDIDNVHKGLPADVQLTAFSQRNTPRIAGEVTYVSADSLVDERTGMPYYTAQISVPEDEVSRIGKDNRLQPGMPAEVFIQTGSRTPLGYLIQPIQESMNRAWREG